jgi:hypothetical protein
MAVAETYEYKILKLDPNSNVAEQLNTEGRCGWRLVPSFLFNSTTEVLLERKKEE